MPGDPRRDAALMRELAKRQPMIGPATGRERPLVTTDFRQKRVGLHDLLIKLGQAIIPDVEGAMRDGDPLGGIVDGPAHAVTQFIKAGIPSKALRAKGTADFVKRAYKMFPESLHAQIDEFARQFPRTVAHVELADVPVLDDIFGETRWLPDDRAKTRTTPFVGALDPGKTRVPVDIAEAGESPDLGVLAHEVGHAAQALGSARTPRLYNLSSHVIASKAEDAGARSSTARDLAYVQNPYEVSARSIARRKIDGSTEPPVSVQRLLSDLTKSRVEKTYDGLGRRKYLIVKSP